MDSNDRRTGDDPVPETWFAPAERMADDELRRTVSSVEDNPLMDTLLWTVGGVIAVLNTERQILAINDALLAMLGLEDAGQTLGLRPGEALDCAHATDHTGGGGTSRFCATCGVAIALVTCQSTGKPDERECVITVVRDGQEMEMDLRVRACPVRIGDQTLILLILDDISEAKRHLSLSRTFLHDFSNTVAALVGASEMLVLGNVDRWMERAGQVKHIAYRLAREIDIQRSLLNPERRDCPVEPREVAARELVDELEGTLRDHPAARTRELRFDPGPNGAAVTTDPSLALRVLTNMVVNALEASEPGKEVRVAVAPDGDQLVFSVWNEGVIPVEVSPRIFQRYFTTMEGKGRGLGTHAMKLIGEQHLGGHVDFHTADGEGTTFRLALPVD